jgi:hypothetical protein
MEHISKERMDDLIKHLKADDNEYSKPIWKQTQIENTLKRAGCEVTIKEKDNRPAIFFTIKGKEYIIEEIFPYYFLYDTSEDTHIFRHIEFDGERLYFIYPPNTVVFEIECL